VKKTGVVVVLLVVFAGAGFFFANRVPTSFLPDEDQGYAYVSLQLPNGASLERTNAVVKQVEKVIMDTPGVAQSTCFVGFSLLSFARTTYNATFFVNFKLWDERKTREEQFSNPEGASESAVEQAAEWRGVRIFSAGDSGSGNRRRLYVHAGRPFRQ